MSLEWLAEMQGRSVDSNFQTPRLGNSPEDEDESKVTNIPVFHMERVDGNICLTGRECFEIFDGKEK
jgi:hypothetical protein